MAIIGFMVLVGGVIHFYVRSFALGMLISAFVIAGLIIFFGLYVARPTSTSVLVFLWGPIWGMVIGFCVGLPFKIWRVLNKPKVIPASWCRTCHYDLYQNSSGTCPECGDGIPYGQMQLLERMKGLPRS